jgi:hypothetical protein
VKNKTDREREDSCSAKRGPIFHTLELTPRLLPTKKKEVFHVCLFQYSPFPEAGVTWDTPSITDR